MKIVIPNYVLPSRNTLYSSNSWRTRSNTAKQVHEMVSSYAPKKLYEKPVNIRIDCFYKHKRRHDSDNIESKLVIDALKGKVIKDDDTRFVKDVTVRAHIGADNNRVEINVQQV